jgi:hypothetical protein
MITGFGGFFACAAVSRQIWQRGASPEEIRRDLEDRVRSPPYEPFGRHTYEYCITPSSTLPRRSVTMSSA